MRQLLDESGPRRFRRALPNHDVKTVVEMGWGGVKNGNQVLFLGESTFPSRIFKLSLDGKVLGVIGRSGRNLKQFSGAHALACPSENEIYAAETANWRVQKLILHQ